MPIACCNKCNGAECIEAEDMPNTSPEWAQAVGTVPCECRKIGDRPIDNLEHLSELVETLPKRERRRALEHAFRREGLLCIARNGLGMHATDLHPGDRPHDPGPDDWSTRPHPQEAIVGQAEVTLKFSLQDDYWMEPVCCGNNLNPAGSAVWCGGQMFKVLGMDPHIVQDLWFCPKCHHFRSMDYEEERQRRQRLCLSCGERLNPEIDHSHICLCCCNPSCNLCTCPWTNHQPGWGSYPAKKAGSDEPCPGDWDGKDKHFTMERYMKGNPDFRCWYSDPGKGIVVKAKRNIQL